MMCKLSSELHKNANRTNILLYQIYLPKLHENILKYYRLDLFKVITIGFLYLYMYTYTCTQSILIDQHTCWQMKTYVKKL